MSLISSKLLNTQPVKTIEEIKPGDFVMGMDLKPLYVNACSNGKARLFSIISKI